MSTGGIVWVFVSQFPRIAGKHVRLHQRRTAWQLPGSVKVMFRAQGMEKNNVLS